MSYWKSDEDRGDYFGNDGEKKPKKRYEDKRKSEERKGKVATRTKGNRHPPRYA